MRWLLAVLLALANGTAISQEWPARPIRLVVPSSPGGSADTLGRLVAQKLGEQLKASFVIENRPGASGVLGSEQVARSAPDGHTLVVSAMASHVIAPHLPAGAPYDTVQDFTHIALFGGLPAVLAVNADLPAADLQSLVKLAKTTRLAYGSGGYGTLTHLLALRFQRLAGIEMEHVPYKGGGAAVNDLVAGHIPAFWTTLSTTGGQVRTGRARALAISSSTRLPSFPGIPTFIELGYPEVMGTAWFGLGGPAGMPGERVKMLNDAVRRALEAPDVRERLRQDGVVPNSLDAREFTAFVADEVLLWGPVVRSLGAGHR
jgi:tripartite-type tricarboxylate transporter receptor subunit TctC